MNEESALKKAGLALAGMGVVACFAAIVMLPKPYAAPLPVPAPTALVISEPPCRDSMANGDETYRFIECNHSAQVLRYEVIAERVYVFCTCKKKDGP